MGLFLDANANAAADMGREIMKFFEEKSVKTEREPREMLRVVRQELSYLAEAATRMAALKPFYRSKADQLTAAGAKVGEIENNLETGKDIEPKAQRTAPAA
ncbi:MAG: hypothetical protein M3R00_10640 [Pseudomonadota bacterium]|nr:hypothetical protein [Pseudomonadota bacterium]